MKFAERTAEKRAMQKGLAKGIKQDEINKAIEIAQKLLDILDDKMIALKTDLTVNDIKKLRKN